MRLLYYANGARYKVNGEWVFRKWVTVSDRDLTIDLRITRPTIRKFRDELAKANYIRFKPGDGKKGTEYTLCPLHGAQKPNAKPTEAYQSLPKPAKQGTPAQGSFDLDEFWEANLRNTFGDD